MWCENYRWNFDYARLAYDAGFSFESQKVQTTLDLAKLGLIDIETLIREKDVSTIERFIPFITQFSLEGEQVKILDPCFVKIFRISQLAVEYLLFCKKYLDNTVVLLKKEISSSLEENKELKTSIHDLKSDANHLRKKLKEIECASLPEIPTFRCDQCGKVFATEDYLQAHIRRRHETSNSTTSAYQEETNKLQLEIKELKERLNTTEKLIIHEKEIDTTKEHSCSKLDELAQKFEILKTHVESELKLLHTQKEFQEKYEKLFEATITKTKAAFVEAECLKGKLENWGEGDLQSRKNSATQTFLQVQEVATEAPLEDLEKEAMSKELQFDLEKMQQEIVAGTQQQISKVEGALGEMVATSLGKIEDQVQTALEKLSAHTIKAQEEHKESPRKSLIPIRAVSAKQSSQRRAVDKSESLPPPGLKTKAAAPKAVTPPKGLKSKDPVVNENWTGLNFVPNLKKKESLAERKSKETIQLFTKKEAMRSETEETESESESDRSKERVQTKPSGTSTLGQYSTASIEKAVSSEEVFNNLRAEIEQLVERRMKELGVSPDWKGLPERSFAQALAVVTHQAELSKKKFANFSKIRRNLVKRLTKIIKDNKTNVVEKRKEDKTKSHNVYNSETEGEEMHGIPPQPISKSAYDSVIKEFKSRAKTEVRVESSSSETIRDADEKGDVAGIKSALRTELQATEKKKVAFVDGNNGVEDVKVVRNGGSTTSVASSVFDAPKPSMNEKRREEKRTADSDLSDWDISEILE